MLPKIQNAFQLETSSAKQAISITVQILIFLCSFPPGTVRNMTLLKVIIAAALIAKNNVEANTFPLEKPEVRYTPWRELDPVVQNIAETKLGYTPVTWNVHGLADIERLGW